MEPEGSLPCSQQPISGPVLGQMNVVSTHPVYLFKIVLILSSHIRISLSSFMFSEQMLHAFLISPERARCSTHPILIDLVVLIVEMVKITNYEACHLSLFKFLK
jgi:hypothetical protein